MVPYVRAEEALSVECGRDVGEYGLDVAFHCVLPLLVWGGGWAGGRFDKISLLSFLRLARTQTRQGWRQNTRRMSDGVTPVLRQVVFTARQSWSSGACPVRSWRRSTRVRVLRATLCNRALLDVLSGSQLGCIPVWAGCGWRRMGCSERRCVSRSSTVSDTRHSLDVGSRCIRSA